MWIQIRFEVISNECSVRSGFYLILIIITVVMNFVLYFFSPQNPLLHCILQQILGATQRGSDVYMCGMAIGRPSCNKETNAMFILHCLIQCHLRNIHIRMIIYISQIHGYSMLKCWGLNVVDNNFIFVFMHISQI